CRAENDRDKEWSSIHKRELATKRHKMHKKMQIEIRNSQFSILSSLLCLFVAHHFSTSAITCPSGSRASNPFEKPNRASPIVTTPGETKRKCSASKFWANMSVALTTSVVCQ